jgi:hypothetical protein
MAREDKPARNGPSSELAEIMKGDAGKGLSDRVVDNAFWLGSYSGAEEWIDTLQDFDAHESARQRARGKQRLIDLLSTGGKPPDLVLHYLADLVERYNWGVETTLAVALKQANRRWSSLQARLVHLLTRYEPQHYSHRPRQPAYDLSQSESRIDVARRTLLARPKGIAFQKALAAVAAQYGISMASLHRAYDGGLGSRRSAIKRLGLKLIATPSDIGLANVKSRATGMKRR